MGKSKFNVVIIEPSSIMVRGLKAILGESERFRIVDTFPDVAKFQEQHAPKGDVDIVIINPTLIAHGKRDAVRTLFPRMSIVALLYNYINRETLGQFDESIEVYDNPSKIMHVLGQAVTHDGSIKTGADAGDLTEREREILMAVARGMINKEIAELYSISIHTVIAHRKNISRKTGIKSVSGLAVYALLNNLIEEHEVL